MSPAHQAIRLVSRRTGLSPHVIRVWEKRYGAVRPERTDTNRRLYSDDQVERLILLRDLTAKGHSIGRIAKLPTDELRQFAADLRLEAMGPRGSSKDSGDHLERCVTAIKAFDAEALEATLKLAVTDLGLQGLLQRVVGPLAQLIGELWREGEISAAHEHFATVVIRTFLGPSVRPFAGAEDAPTLVVATPSGQLHELGALLVGAMGGNMGWRVTYLGPSLPAAEIAGAVRQNRARALALSLVYPEDDSRLEGELIRLRELLPAEVALLVGGRAMRAYQTVLNKIGARQLKDLAECCSALDELRGARDRNR